MLGEAAFGHDRPFNHGDLLRGLHGAPLARLSTENTEARLRRAGLLEALAFRGVQRAWRASAFSAPSPCRPSGEGRTGPRG